MKYICLFLMVLMVTACASEQVGLLSVDDEEYPELDVGDVKILSHAVVEESCKQISIIITKPQADINHILKDLRGSAAKVGGNLVNINSIGYMPDPGKEDKYATATVYLCR